LILWYIRVVRRSDSENIEKRWYTGPFSVGNDRKYHRLEKL
jgi:hypothetical protein